MEMRHLQAGAKLCEIGRMQLHITMPAAINVVLDVLDHAITAVVHQHDEQVGPLLHGTGEFADIEHEAAVTRQHHGLAAKLVAAVGDGGANAHRQALADAATKRVHTGTRMVEVGRAIAPHAVGQGDITHPPELAAGDTGHAVLERDVGAQCGVHHLPGGLARLLHVHP